jgi:hypothetical protein
MGVSWSLFLGCVIILKVGHDLLDSKNPIENHL